GIEEQSVNVIIDLSPGQPVDRLGHGYRVDVAVEVWTSDDELTAPMTALFKQDRAWSVYRVEGGHARLRTVEVGQMNGRVAQILAGLEEGDLLVEHPSSRIEDRVKVKARQAPRPVAPETDPDVMDAELAAAWDNGTSGCDFLIR
ncbi:MAG: hypothetical protein AAFO88_10215, partial [Pseudomonadota bacterium]